MSKKAKTPYDHSHAMFREMLGLHLIGVLEDAGFAEADHKITNGGNERVFYRHMPNTDRKTILVYTTISKGTNVVRENGNDAIRVCGVYKSSDGQMRGLVSKKRVNRTGYMEDIGDRMLERMRGTWSAMRSCESCRQCGAPMFVSKAGNSVCAEVCWTRSDPVLTDWQNRYKKIKNKWRENE